MFFLFQNIFKNVKNKSLEESYNEIELAGPEF